MTAALPRLRLVAQAPIVRPAPEADDTATRRLRRPLQQVLLESGAVDPGDLVKAVALAARQNLHICDILVARGWIAEEALLSACTEASGALRVDLAGLPPDPRLIDAAGASRCLQEAAVPWRRVGSATVIATARPHDFDRFARGLPEDLAPFVMALAPEADVRAAVLRARAPHLAAAAEAKVDAAESCRSLSRKRLATWAGVATGSLAMFLWAVPFAVFGGLAGLAVTLLTLWTALKLAAVAAAANAPLPTAPAPKRASVLPKVSLLVPLFREGDIAGQLVERLMRLDYPQELLDILLVTEAQDGETRAALSRMRLPATVRVVTVPDGAVRTKPRALNYALNLCRGSIVGVYDAEDRPAADQVRKVVARFAETGRETACVQGMLDFYAAERNWLSRCFAIEYAVWFRAVLPGLARLGLVVPLGGTTLFFRRDVLEEIGGWDAHNVTEDADLGLRLARRGYRTEIVATVTEEEPNARLLPWVRQRSRWLKGYALTWAVHMRRPGRLWRELGAWRFAGVQVLFLGSFLQFLLAPVLWAFWLLAFGLDAGVGERLGPHLIPGLAVWFVLCELVAIGSGLWATWRAGHRRLMPWVPTLMFYFPLGTFAAAKALAEIATRPFFWDKTEHGLIGGSDAPAVEPRVEAEGRGSPPPRRVEPKGLPAATRLDLALSRWRARRA